MNVRVQIEIQAPDLGEAVAQVARAVSEAVDQLSMYMPDMGKAECRIYLPEREKSVGSVTVRPE
jgi:hypothetical protein